MTPSQKAIQSLRTGSGWWSGDANAEKVLDAYREVVTLPIRTELSVMTAERNDAVAAAQSLADELAHLKNSK